MIHDRLEDSEQGGSLEEYLARVARLAPEVERSVADSERLGYLSPQLTDALHREGLYRLLLPRDLDGGELDPFRFVQVLEEVAKLDASVAWCLCQTTVCSVIATHYEPAVAREIFGPPDAVLAWGPGSGMRAIAVEGGYRVTGDWKFASGSHQATWLGGRCPIFLDEETPRITADGVQDHKTMLFPASSAVLKQVWDVSGLRATGSDNYSANDVFVPERHAVFVGGPEGRRLHTPLYCFSMGALWGSGFAGVALGIARAMLDAIIILAREKTPRLSPRPLRDSQILLTMVGESDARLRSSRAFLLGTLADVTKTAAREQTIPLADRVTVRLAATHAVQEASDVVSAAYRAAGADAIFNSGPFARRFRDFFAVTQQGNGRRDHYETAGLFLLGLEPDQTFL